jgi:hypothetical protein
MVPVRLDRKAANQPVEKRAGGNRQKLANLERKLARGGSGGESEH